MPYGHWTSGGIDLVLKGMAVNGDSELQRVESAKMFTLEARAGSGSRPFYGQATEPLRKTSSCGGGTLDTRAAKRKLTLNALQTAQNALKRIQDAFDTSPMMSPNAEPAGAGRGAPEEQREAAPEARAGDGGLRGGAGGHG